MKKIIYFLVLAIGLVRLNAQNKDVDLLNAVKSNNFKTVVRLVESGADVNYKDTNNASVLMWAVYKCDIDLVKYLVKNGAIYDSNGFIKIYKGYYGSPLVIAAGEGKLDILKFLLNKFNINIDEREFDPTTHKHTGWTPLLWAVARNQTETVDYLIKKNANINLQESATGYTPLMYSVLLDYNKMFCKLLEAGADTSLTCNKGYNVKYIVIKKKNYFDLACLYGLNYDLNMQNKLFFTLYHTVTDSLKSSFNVLEKDIVSHTFDEDNSDSAYIKDKAGILRNIYLWLAGIYDNGKDTDNMIVHYKKAIEVSQRANITHSEEYTDILVQLGKIYIDNGEYDAGLDLINKALKIDEKIYGKNSKTWIKHDLYLAYYYSKLQNQTETHKHINRQLFFEQNPSYAEITDYLLLETQIYVNLNDYSKITSLVFKTIYYADLADKENDCLNP